MQDKVSRQFITAKINIITESKKHTVFSETFSQYDMQVKYPLPQEYLNQKNPIIFQIVYQSEVRSYIFNVGGFVSSDAPMVVVFSPQSLSLIHQFISEFNTKKKTS